MAFGTRAEEGVVGLAQVIDGWTGYVRIVIGLNTTTITPSTTGTDSAIRIVLALVASAARETGADVQAWADSTGKLRIYSSSTWRLVSSGTTMDRLTTPASDVLSAGVTWEASTAHANGYYPSRGLAIRGAPAAFTSSHSSGEGAYAGANVLGTSSISFTGYETLADQWTDELAMSDGSTWDLWRDGFYVLRARMGRTTRARWGSLGSEATLRFQGDLVRGGFA